MTIRSFFNAAFRGCVVRRALIMSAVVGSILIGINHGTCIVTGKFCKSCAIQSGLTLLVPYCVSTISCVLAHRDDLQPSSDRLE